MTQTITVDVDVNPARWERETGMSLADFVATAIEEHRLAHFTGLTVTAARPA